MTQFFDAHTHPQFAAYDSDRKEVITRAREAGVKMIAVGTQAGTSEAAVRLAEEYPDDVWATVGFHPNHLTENWYHDKSEQTDEEQEKFDIEKLRVLARHKKAVAIGECGLDYYRYGDENKKRQVEGFVRQIELAAELGKPLMIHCREAFKDIIQILQSHRKSLTPGVCHFFTGTEDDAKALLELGFSFTFGGVITFARDYDEVVKLAPLDRILSETDAPYVTPVPYRGKRNEPAYVVEAVKKLAELKNVSFEEMARYIFENAVKLFRLGELA